MLRFLSKYLAVLMLLVASGVEAGEGTVTGRLQLESGKPLGEGQVFFFDTASSLERPVLGKFWRVPDFVDQTAADGTFAVTLPESVYYIAAVKRMSDVQVGPPVDGDFFLPSHDRKGTYRTVTVKAGEAADIGVVKGIQRYISRNSTYKGKVSAIEGKLSREDGSPAPGMLVFAYIDPAMQGKPQFVSVKSDRNGRYRLLIDKGRIVYLKARDSYSGGSPRPGAPVGVYGGAESHIPVAARTNAVVHGIDIVVRPFAQRVQ